MRIRPPRLLWHFSYVVLRLVLGALLRVRYEFPDQPVRGPILFVAKHCRYWETPLIGMMGWPLCRERTNFEMSTFHGYPVLGQIRWLLRLLGGFEVMRPKDLLRLKHKTGRSREELRAEMERVNTSAAELRRAILRGGATYAYYPEGTRDAAEVRPFKSVDEIEEAIGLAETENLPVVALPLLPIYGPAPSWRIPWIRRQTVVLRVLDPIPLAGRDAAEVGEEIRDLMLRHWRPVLSP
jgi:1-acyl-sn-glycerol-3-phosphate acyltransferase